jgi:hypothetical protein
VKNETKTKKGKNKKTGKEIREQKRTSEKEKNKTKK